MSKAHLAPQFNIYKIPICEQWNIDCLENGWAVFGFGGFPQNALANDYKFVRIACTFKLSGEVVCQAQIYSISSNNWKIIDLNMILGYELVLPNRVRDTMLINGVLYWKANKLNRYNETVIVSFNVNDEVLQFVDFSKCCQEYCTYDIIQWNGKVAVIKESNDQGTLSYDVWVLNLATNCWSKKLKFEILSETEFIDNYFIGSVKSGDLIFEDLKAAGASQLYLYDPVSKEIKRRYEFRITLFIRNYCYVESLLPVNNNDHTHRI